VRSSKKLKRLQIEYALHAERKEVEGDGDRERGKA